MGKLSTTLLWGLLLLAVGSPAWGEEKAVKLTTLDWEPYIGESLDKNGYVAEVVRSAFKAGGVQSNLFFLSWDQAVELGKTGNADGVFPEYMSEERKTDFIYSDPIPGGPLVLLKLKTKNINYTGKVDELRGLKLGVVKGYVNTKEIDAADFLTREEAEDDISNIKNLLSGKVDLIVIDKLVAGHAMETDQILNAHKDKVESIEPVLEVKPLYIIFSKKAPNGEEKRKAFNAGLSNIKGDGALDKILKEMKVEGLVSM